MSATSWSAGQVADHQVTDHLTVVVTAGGVDQVNAEDGAEGVAVGHPEEAERADHHVHVNGLSPAAEGPCGVAAVDDRGYHGHRWAVQLAEGIRPGDELAVVDVLDGHHADEVRM